MYTISLSGFCAIARSQFVWGFNRRPQAAAQRYASALEPAAHEQAIQRGASGQGRTGDTEGGSGQGRTGDTEGGQARG